MGAERRGNFFDFLGGRVSAGCKLKRETHAKQPSIAEWGQGPEDGETTGASTINVMGRTQSTKQLHTLV